MTSALTIRAAQQEVAEFLGEKGDEWTHFSDHYYIMTHFVEEVGELARAIINLETKVSEPRRRGLNKPQGEKLAVLQDGLGDLFYNLCVVSEAYSLDLQEAFQGSMRNIKSRYLENVSS